MRLPSSLESCVGCSRRTALKGIGAAALVPLALTVPGCVSPNALPVGVATACPGGLCVDLSAPENAPLDQIGGAVLIDGAGDRIAVIRTSDTTATAVSAICTHAGCLCEYDPSHHTLDCPCHGSQFAEDGHVLAGPAVRPLRVHAATLSMGIITIV